MSTGTPTNTRRRQLAKKKPVKMVPHGPGGQMLRPAPKTKTRPRTPQARARGKRVVEQASRQAFTPRKYVPHGPGGQNLRPAPKVRVKPRSPQARAHGVRVVQRAAHPTYGPTKHPVLKAKPRSAKAKAHGVQVVKRSAANVRHKEQQKARKYITQNPIKGLQKSEANAIEALSELRASNPKKYDKNLKKQNVPDVVDKALHKSDPLEVGLKDIGKGIKSVHLHGSAGNLAASTLASSLPGPTAAIGKAIGPKAGKAFENAIREASDIPTNIVPSTVHIIKPAYEHPGDPKAYVKSAKRFGNAAISLPKKYVKAYEKKGIKGVEDTFVKYPLSTALTLAPIPRAPGLLVGGVARRLGKMPHIEPRVLPGTAMKEAVPRSKSYFKAKRQSKKGQEQIVEKVPGPFRRQVHALSRGKIGFSASPIERRIDEHVSLMEHLARRKQVTTYRKAYRAQRKEGIKKSEARDAAAELARKEQQAARIEQENKIVEGMAILQKAKSKSGQVIHPATSNAQIFKTHAVARSIANRYESQYGVKMQPIQYRGGYAVMPKSAVKRLEKHAANTEIGPVGAAAKMYNNAWRKNVLATHPTWYAGNVIEAAVRSLASGVGPTAYRRGYKSLAELKRIDPKAYDEMTGHGTKGGHLEMQAHLPDQKRVDITGENFLADTARSVQSIRNKPVVRNVADGMDRITDIAMGTLSGKVESFFQTGMLGKELARNPLMDGHIYKTSKAAIADAAKGMRETHNQVALGQAIDRMYGKYGKFSPGMRKQIAHYTPFIAWTLNSLNWLYRYLPVDHPVLTATAASVQPYVEHWLKDKKLSAFVKGALPSFLQGSIPTAHGGHTRFPTRYTPFSVAAGMPEDIASAVLPQFSGALDVLQHQINWKGQKVTNPDGTPLDKNQLGVMAALTLLEGLVPASQQLIDPATHYEKGARTPKELLALRTGKEIGRAFNPLATVPKKKAKKKKAGSLYDSNTTTKTKSLYDSPSTTKQKSLYDSP